MDANDVLPNLVYQHATHSADKVALTSIGQGSATWSELLDRAKRWSGWLRSNGVNSGDRVVTLVPQSLEAAYVWLGCCYIGAVEVSINSEFRGAWLKSALQASSAKTVVVSKRFLDRLLPVIEGSGIEMVLVYDDPAADVQVGGNLKIICVPPASAQPIEIAEAPKISPHDIACVLYTSGTTGVSKAVQISWTQLHATWHTGIAFERPGKQVYYFPYAPHHLSGRGALYRAALTNNQSILREAFSTASFWSDVRQYGCTWTLLYAAPMRFIANLPERPDDLDNTLELVLLCPVLPDVDQVKRRFGFEAYAVYGMTEIGNPFVVHPEDVKSVNAGCAGRPIAGVEARLADGNDYPVKAGEPGELLIRSETPWLFTPGYQGLAEASAQVWRNGWFHTGDILRLNDDGNYYYVDRVKDMIRRRGENISSVELEQAVLSHDAVAECAAVGVPSALGDEDVMVAVVPKPGQTVEPSALIGYLKEIVPRFAVPRYIKVVDSLPRTPASLRVQKTELRAQGVTKDTWDQQAKM